MKYIKMYEIKSLEKRTDIFADAVKNDKKALINKMIDNDINQNEGEFILIAVIYNDEKILKKLIKKGVDLNALTQAGYSPLIFTAIQGFHSCMNTLIEAGADWNIIDDSGHDFLRYLPSYLRNKTIEKYPEQYKEYLFRKESEKYNL